MSMSAYRTVSTRHLEWFIHILIWTIIIAERWINHFPGAENPLVYGSYQTISLLLTFIVPIYVNAFVLVPLYLKKAKWLKFTALLIAMILVANVARGLLAVLYFQVSGMEYNLSTEFTRWAFRDYASLERFVFRSPTSLILLVSFAYRLIKDWLTHERIASKLRSEKVAMELAFLKSQVDPHFLFNTLNNLYALALEEKAQRTADGVAKMGTLMRYSLHDSQTEQIYLYKEIDYIEKYIELQKLRIVEGPHVDIRADLLVSSIQNEKIAPMILLPFVENAFKYGISTVQGMYIAIELKLENGILKLSVKNTIHEKKSEGGGGIGLSNVRNRLRLIYPQRHSLTCTKNNGIYHVDLQLDLRND